MVRLNCQAVMKFAGRSAPVLLVTKTFTGAETVPAVIVIGLAGGDDVPRVSWSARAAGAMRQAARAKAASLFMVVRPFSVGPSARQAPGAIGQSSWIGSRSGANAGHCLLRRGVRATPHQTVVAS